MRVMHQVMFYGSEGCSSGVEDERRCGIGECVRCGRDIDSRSTRNLWQGSGLVQEISVQA